MLNVYEKFALNQFLSYYPENASFDEIIEMMRDYNEDVIVWDPFFDAEPEDVILSIENMVKDLRETFIPKENVYRKNPQYTDIVSDGGMDPRDRPRDKE
jgi:hypothetical protein